MSLAWTNDEDQLLAELNNNKPLKNSTNNNNSNVASLNSARGNMSHRDGAQVLDKNAKAGRRQS